MFSSFVRLALDLEGSEHKFVKHNVVKLFHFLSLTV